jgi:hypothetical protein
MEESSIGFSFNIQIVSGGEIVEFQMEFMA